MVKKRISKSRDLKTAIHLFVEGESEEVYFNALKKLYRMSALKVTRNNNPIFFRSKVNDKAKNNKSENYKYYCVFDLDIYPAADKLDLIQRASNDNLYMTNPCIETWFYLHFDKLEANQATDKGAIESLLRTNIDCNYQKACLVKDIIDVDKINVAIENAEKLFQSPLTLETIDDNWTNLHILAKELIQESQK